jgi:sigma-B regulation protein RsbU (phosphoserine phosphatase)
MLVTQYLNPRLSGCLYQQAQPQLDPRQLVINDPPDAMRALNDQLMRQGIGSSYLTCLYGVLELRTGRVRMVRAGHTLPLISHADGSVEVIDDEGDFPLGLIEDTTFHAIERTLAPGARLCLYSDGITECENPTRDGEQFGLERLRTFLAAQARQPVAQATARFADVVREWAGPTARSFADDVSMLLIEYRGTVPPAPGE